MAYNLAFLLQNGADDSILRTPPAYTRLYPTYTPPMEHHNTIENARSWRNGVKGPKDGWRPSNHHDYPVEYRNAMETLVVLAKTKRA